MENKIAKHIDEIIKKHRSNNNFQIPSNPITITNQK